MVTASILDQKHMQQARRDGPARPCQQLRFLVGRPLLKRSTFGIPAPIAKWRNGSSSWVKWYQELIVNVRETSNFKGNDFKFKVGVKVIVQQWLCTSGTNYSSLDFGIQLLAIYNGISIVNDSLLSNKREFENLNSMVFSLAIKCEDRNDDW